MSISDDTIPATLPQSPELHGVDARRLSSGSAPNPSSGVGTSLPSLEQVAAWANEFFKASSGTTPQTPELPSMPGTVSGFAPPDPATLGRRPTNGLPSQPPIFPLISSAALPQSIVTDPQVGGQLDYRPEVLSSMHPGSPTLGGIDPFHRGSLTPQPQAYGRESLARLDPVGTPSTPYYFLHEAQGLQHQDPNAFDVSKLSTTVGQTDPTAATAHGRTPQGRSVDPSAAYGALPGTVPEVPTSVGAGPSLGAPHYSAAPTRAAHGTQPVPAYGDYHQTPALNYDAKPTRAAHGTQPVPAYGDYHQTPAPNYDAKPTRAAHDAQPVPSFGDYHQTPAPNYSATPTRGAHAAQPASAFSDHPHTPAPNYGATPTRGTQAVPSFGDYQSQPVPNYDAKPTRVAQDAQPVVAFGDYHQTPTPNYGATPTRAAHEAQSIPSFGDYHQSIAPNYDARPAQGRTNPNPGYGEAARQTSLPRQDDDSVTERPRPRAFNIEAIRADFPILSERVNGKPLVWLDNAATTQKPQAVIDRLAYFYAHENSNINRAAHSLAARSADAYEGARESVRRFLNAGSTEEIIFVRGCTEGINLIANSWGGRYIEAGDEIIVTRIEHHSNIVPWQMLCARTGAKLRIAEVDDTGQVRLDQYQRLFNSHTRLVSFTHVSNALGTILPAKEMVEIAHRNGARVVIDGAQSVCHMAVDVQKLDPDFYVFSGHKVFGPTGVGAVYGKQALLQAMPPWQGGGSMISDVTFEKAEYNPPPARFEAGTGNIADAVGLGTALEYLEALGLDNVARHEHELLEYGTKRLSEIPGLHFVGTAKEKAAVLGFVLENMPAEQVGRALAAEGIAVRAGHHCAQPALRRFGHETTVRPSLAVYNNRADIDTLVGTLHDLQSRWLR